MKTEQRKTDKLNFKQKMLNVLSEFHSLISNTDENDLNMQEATNRVDEAFSLPESQVSILQREKALLHERALIRLKETCKLISHHCQLFRSSLKESRTLSKQISFLESKQKYVNKNVIEEDKKKESNININDRDEVGRTAVKEEKSIQLVKTDKEKDNVNKEINENLVNNSLEGEETFNINEDINVVIEEDGTPKMIIRRF